MNQKVLLGMSGGIDSSVAAMALLEQGFEVTGVTFLFSGNSDDSVHNVLAAKSLAQVLGIKHHSVDLRKAFDKRVVHYFKKSYLQGETPFPCAVCNPELKFARLFKMAAQLECNYISTGHYVKVIENQGIKYIAEGTDPEKDQSFFLWGLSNDVINRLIFPLGNIFKQEVRKLAIKHSFSHLTEKKESLGICFINNGNYREYLAENEVIAKPGHFIDSEGTIMGNHQGIINYTIGQRKGLNVQVNKPVFVIEIRPESNEIVLGEYEELYRSRIFLHKVRFVDVNQMNANAVYKVRIRYRNQENLCRVMFHDKQKAVIELLEPVAMVAPGQTAVIYEDGRVLGGGFIVGSE